MRPYGRHPAHFTHDDWEARGELHDYDWGYHNRPARDRYRAWREVHGYAAQFRPRPARPGYGSRQEWFPLDFRRIYGYGGTHRAPHPERRRMG